MKDQELLNLLRSDKRTVAFQQLYKGYPAVERLVLSKGGNKNDARDIFQDALFIFYQQLIYHDLKLSAAISTYLYSVCRFLWKDKLKQNKKFVSLDFESGLSIEEVDRLSQLMEKEAKHKAVEKVIRELGERCLELLQLFYFKRLSMDEIAKAMGLSSAKVAKNQKYKCLERARAKVSSETIGV